MRENKAFKIYSKLAVSESNPEVRSGRAPRSKLKSLNAYIFNDVFRKLEVKKNLSILSIGVGCGELSRRWLDRASILNLSMTMIDFPSVLDKIKKDNQDITFNNVDLIPGIFPNQTQELLKGRLFDRIEAYSVIHYSDNPFEFIDSAVNYLKPNGRLLIGDIPNLNKKGRFLATKFGNAFDQQFSKKSDDQVVKYVHHEDYVADALKDGAPILTDSFIEEVFKHFRAKGFNVYILKQHSRLPYNFTREDLIIEAPFE